MPYSYNSRFVEFETAADLKTAVDKLDNQEFKGATVRCTADVSHIQCIFAASKLTILVIRPKTKLPVIVIDPVLLINAVEVIMVVPPTITMVVAVALPLEAAIVLAVKTIAIVLLHVVMTTTRVIVIAHHHVVFVAPLLMTDTLQLAAHTAMTLTRRPHRPVATTTLTLMEATIVLQEPGLPHQELMQEHMKSVHVTGR